MELLTKTIVEHLGKKKVNAMKIKPGLNSSAKVGWHRSMLLVSPTASPAPALRHCSWPELLVSICPAPPPCLKATPLCRRRLGKQGSWWEATLADPANLERATFWLATKNTASLVRDWVVVHDDNHCF